MRYVGPHGSSVTIFSPSAKGSASATSTPKGTMRPTHRGHRRSFSPPVMPTFSSASMLSSPTGRPSSPTPQLTGAGGGAHSAAPVPPVPVFSHAPSGSPIAVRNGKKALFYLAYLRRGQLDEAFLSSAAQMATSDVASKPIVIDIEEDDKTRDVYAAYLATEVHCA